MRDGLYKDEYETRTGVGVGLAHLLGGRIWGGDAMIY